MNRKETFFDYKNKNFSASQKWRFRKGLTHASGQKNAIFFHYLFSLKIRVEERVNNVLKRKKKAFLDCKNKIFHSPKNRIFPKGLTHAFGQKMQLFSLFVFGQNKSKNNVT